MNLRPIRRGALAAVAAGLLLAGPAAAHPAFEPDEAPVDSLAELTLDLVHGCTADEDGEAAGEEAGEEATREVAIEVPAEVDQVVPAEADGWDLELETASDGTIEVVVYTAREGTDEPAPRFDLEAVHRGEVGDEVHWRVVQACEDTTHRWVGTEDEEAEDPAVPVTLTEADPTAPPPEEDPQQDPADEGAADDEPDADEPTDADPDADEGDDAEADGEDDLVEDAADATGMPGWLLIVVLVATLAVAGVVLLLRDRGTGPDDERPTAS